MTVAELYKQVAQLGFEVAVEDVGGFYSAANRAILQVNRLRPAIGCCFINHKPLNNLVKQSTFAPIDKDDDLIFEATNAKSYYFEADGNGFAYIEKAIDDKWEIIKEIPLESGRVFAAYRGFIKDAGEFITGDVRIRFAGEYFYSVKCIALYGQIFSDDEQDIPAFAAYARYDIAKMVSDFVALRCPPIKQDEQNTILNQEYEVEGNSVILLPYNERGIYKVMYERMLKQLVNENNVENDESIIDLDEELCSLLPLNIAAYVWADDEPTKAEYYLSLYRERVAEISATTNDIKPAYVKSSNGW